MRCLRQSISCYQYGVFIGMKKNPVNQKGNIFQVTTSPFRVLFLKRFNVMATLMTQAGTPDHVASQKKHATPVQISNPDAARTLAFVSPRTSGTVFLPVWLSPSMSLKSWVWDTVVIAAAITIIQIIAVLSRIECPVAISRGPAKKQANPSPLSRFLRNGSELPFHSL